MILIRFPHQKDIFTIETTENNDFSVAFFDFDQQKKVHFSGRKRMATEHDFLKIEQLFHHKNFHLHAPSTPDDYPTYEEKIKTIKEFLTEENLPKLVFSRRKYHFFEDEISIVDSFQKMCNTYPQALVYLFVSEQECWMGGFYEILGKYNKKNQEFHTMSLAGTLPLNESWTEKEIQEQNTVTQYITGIIKQYTSDYQISSLKDAISGNIKHLCTEFSAIINEKEVQNLIHALHPTPAVCGTPKHLCKKKIEELETEERKLYSGYIDIASAEEKTCFVNLRCAQIYANGAKIFVGGGINEQSHPEKEWLETELKAEAILKNLVFLR